MTNSMADVDIIKPEPMDLNDDDKGSDSERKLENGENGSMDITPTVEMTGSGLERHGGKVVQITNVSPGATIQQLATLFGFLGTVTDIRLYPSEETEPPIQVKVCYVCYENNEQCGVAQHLTNTVFIDKALIVVPINRDEIPEESECQHLIKSINAYATFSSTGYLPHGFPVAEPGCTIPGIPPPPVITHSSDPVEVEEIKRTIFVENVQGDVTSEQLMAFFSGVGEVKYMRICKKDDTKYAFIEFSASESVPTALQYNGVFFGGMCLKVEHAKSPIVKPESERIAAGRNPLRSGRDTVKRPTSANWGMRVINAHVGEASPTTEDKGRRSRSRSRSRRSSSRGRSKSSRSKARSRSGSRSSRRRKSRSKSPRRRSSPVRSKRRSRSRTRSPVRRRRSRSKSRSRSRSWSKRKRSRSRSRSRTRRRRSPTRSRSRSPRRTKKKSKSRSRSPRRKSRKRSVSKSPDRRKSKSDKDKDKGKDKDDKKEKSSKDKSKDKEKSEKDKDKEKGSKDKEKTKEKEKEKDATPEKDLKSLLDKVYTYEEEKEKEKERLKDKDAAKDL